MHSDIYCFTTKPDKYEYKNENELFGLMNSNSEESDYVAKVDTTKNDLNKTVKEIAKMLHIKYKDNYLIIDDARLLSMQIEHDNTNIDYYCHCWAHFDGVFSNFKEAIQKKLYGMHGQVRFYLMEVFDYHF